jgi:fructose-1,6-bisphosphatase/inositol monophosphatase family enzyme
MGHDPATEATRLIDAMLRQNLLQDSGSWLSEERADDFSRLQESRLWAGGPLDGTREFVAGVAECCAPIAMVENGRPSQGESVVQPRTKFFLALCALASPITANWPAPGRKIRAKY